MSIQQNAIAQSVENTSVPNAGLANGRCFPLLPLLSLWRVDIRFTRSAITIMWKPTTNVPHAANLSGIWTVSSDSSTIKLPYRPCLRHTTLGVLVFFAMIALVDLLCPITFWVRNVQIVFRTILLKQKLSDHLTLPSKLPLPPLVEGVNSSGWLAARSSRLRHHARLL